MAWWGSVESEEKVHVIIRIETTLLNWDLRSYHHVEGSVHVHAMKWRTSIRTFYGISGLYASYGPLGVRRTVGTRTQHNWQCSGSDFTTHLMDECPFGAFVFLSEMWLQHLPERQGSVVWRVHVQRCQLWVSQWERKLFPEISCWHTFLVYIGCQWQNIFGQQLSLHSNKCKDASWLLGNRFEFPRATMWWGILIFGRSELRAASFKRDAKWFLCTSKQF